MWLKEVGMSPLEDGKNLMDANKFQFPESLTYVCFKWKFNFKVEQLRWYVEIVLNTVGKIWNDIRQEIYFSVCKYWPIYFQSTALRGKIEYKGDLMQRVNSSTYELVYKKGRKGGRREEREKEEEKGKGKKKRN